MTQAASHWTSPDTLGDILAIAHRPDAAEPCEIRVRSEVHSRLLQETSAGTRRIAIQHGTISHLDGIPLVIDDELPAHPGYEVHRASPTRSAVAA